MSARSIVIAMTGNANYPTPFPTLLDITTALDDLGAKNAAAAGRDKTAIASRNSWNAAKSLIRQLASYVQMHCLNDLAILLSSGFTSTKTPAPIGPLPAPENLRLSRTDMTGKILLRLKRVYGATAGYLAQTAADSAGPFTDYVLSTTTRVFIDGRTPLTTVWVRVRAKRRCWPGPVQRANLHHRPLGRRH